MTKTIPLRLYDLEYNYFDDNAQTSTFATEDQAKAARVSIVRDLIADFSSDFEDEIAPAADEHRKYYPKSGLFDDQRVKELQAAGPDLMTDAEALAFAATAHAFTFRSTIHSVTVDYPIKTLREALRVHDQIGGHHVFAAVKADGLIYDYWPVNVASGEFARDTAQACAEKYGFTVRELNAPAVIIKRDDKGLWRIWRKGEPLPSQPFDSYDHAQAFARDFKLGEG